MPCGLNLPVQWVEEMSKTVLTVDDVSLNPAEDLAAAIDCCDDSGNALLCKTFPDLAPCVNLLASCRRVQTGIASEGVLVVV